MSTHAMRIAAGCMLAITATVSLLPFRFHSPGPGFVIAAHVIGYAASMRNIAAGIPPTID